MTRVILIEKSNSSLHMAAYLANMGQLYIPHYLWMTTKTGLMTAKTLADDIIGVVEHRECHWALKI